MPGQTVEYLSSLYGGFWDFEVKDFCYMTNPFFPPETLLEDLGVHLAELVKAYPSTNWYVSSLLAGPLGLTEQEVVVGNGASELIDILVNRFVRNLAIPMPTFNEFTNRAKTLGRKVSPFLLRDEFKLDPEAFVRHVRKTRANAAVLIRPNNPTGSLISKSDLAFLLEDLRDLDLVLVDDSFIEFVTAESDQAASNLVFEFPNLIVLKSLSKNYGIPGLRLGYAVSGNSERVKQLRQDLPIWNINSLAQFFLRHYGEYREEFTVSCLRVREATHLLFQQLGGVPYLHPFPTQGNFVLCRVLSGFTGEGLTSALFDQYKILVNNCGRKEGLEDSYIRIASRTKGDNAALVAALHGLHAEPSSGHPERARGGRG
jgi:histidinol-phosphate/aromatic aminotransferase/cobyric acid decarboxylase-like protein